MSFSRIFIFGDSHIQAVKHGIKKLKKSLPNSLLIKAYRYVQHRENTLIGDLESQQIASLVSKIGSGGLVVSIIGGNQHQVFSLIQHPVPFDFFLPEVSGQDIRDGMQIIPFAQIMDHFEYVIREEGDGARLKALRSVAKCRLVHVIPPPPKADSEYLLKKLELDYFQACFVKKNVRMCLYWPIRKVRSSRMFFRLQDIAFIQRFSRFWDHVVFFITRRFLKVRLSPENFRLKVWKVQTMALQKLAREWGIELMLPPEEALDQNGFLARPYYADDATHANGEYGALLIKKMLSL